MSIRKIIRNLEILFSNKQGLYEMIEMQGKEIRCLETDVKDYAHVVENQEKMIKNLTFSLSLAEQRVEILTKTLREEQQTFAAAGSLENL